MSVCVRQRVCCVRARVCGACTHRGGGSGRTLSVDAFLAIGVSTRALSLRSDARVISHDFSTG